jgi:sugar phosphate isomerase/epimerase
MKITCAWMYAIGMYGFPPATADIYKAVAEMRAMGFAYGELEGIGYENLARIIAEKKEIRQAYRDAGVKVSNFAVLIADIISMDPAVKAKAMDAFERGAEAAAWFESDFIWIDSYFPPLTLLGGVLPTTELVYGQSMRVRVPDGFSWEAFWDDFVATIARCTRIAREHGLPLLVEPRVGETVTTSDAMLRLWDAVHDENLGFILDVAHQHAQKELMPLAIEKLGRHMKYIHVADNDSRDNRHLPPGEGTVDWDEVFSLLARRGFDGYYAIDLERLPDLPGAFDSTRRFLERQALAHHL